MDFTMYQKGAHVTSKIPAGMELTYPTMGLCREAGEVAEKMKKLYRDKGGVIDEAFIELMTKELGDVLWYVSELCTNLGLDLGHVAYTNLLKLKDRAERGKIHGEGDLR
jgi:NTP pyrophosphatase (non-canonical NTP hydrolase)